MNRKADLKKTGDELQAYLQFRRRGSKVENRKGKGAYTRKQKHKSTKIKRDIVLNMAYSSNGLGYETLNLMIASSNLRYVTNEFGVVAEFMSYD